MSKILVKALIGIENFLIKIIVLCLFNRRNGSRVQRILIFLTGGIGDFIVKIPAIKKIRDMFPDSTILLLYTDSSNSKISKMYPDNPEWFDFVDHLVNDKIFVKGYKILKYDNIRRIRNIIKVFNPQIIFILDPLGAGFINKFKKLIYLWLIGVRGKIFGLKIAFDFSIKSLRYIYFRLGLIKNIVWGPLGAVYEIKNFFYNNNSIEYSINIDVEKVRDEIKNIQDENIVAIFPGGKFPIKLWSLEKYADLIKKIKQKYNLNIYLIGGESDKYGCSTIENLVPSLIKHNFCGKLNLMETAYIIKKSKLFIGNDSGITHLSVALNIPTIVIENAQNFPGFWWSSDFGNVYIIRKTVDCQYCHSYPICPTGTFECIKKIEVNEVWDIVDKVLEKLFPIS